MSEFQIRDGNLIASFDLENEDGDIDCCKLFKVTHGVANEIGMFVDYVATNKIIKDQSKQIAEKDQAIESLEELNKSLGQTCNNDRKEIERLNKLLAEKEEKLNSDWYKICPRCNNPYGASQFPSKDENGKEIYVCSNCNEKELFYEPLIKQLEDQNDRLIKQRDDANLKLAEKEKSYKWTVCKLCEIEINQDKISFAVEQLEKVKEWCEDNYDTCDDTINDCKGKVIGLDKVIFNADKPLYEFIDQQIEQLKEK